MNVHEPVKVACKSQLSHGVSQAAMTERRNLFSPLNNVSETRIVVFSSVR